jgi:hypothetical protein
MNEQAVKLIEQLAQKLGTTSEYLWKVLIKQAPISAFTDILYFILTIIGGVVIFKIHKRLLKKDSDGDSIYYKAEEGAIIPMIIITLLWIICFLGFFFSIGDIINGFLNPEYWALKQVLSSCK